LDNKVSDIIDARCNHEVQRQTFVFSKGLNNKTTIKYGHVDDIKYIPLIFLLKA